MASLATTPRRDRSAAVNDRHIISDEEAWARASARPGDGRALVTGVLKTTGIYCRPSCPARQPKRENVASSPRRGGARRRAIAPACAACPTRSAARRRRWKRRLRLLAAAEEAPTLDELAAAVGYSPHHFHRLFKRATGVTPAAYYRSLRARRAETALAENERITDAIYDAGYSGPARFYADAKGRLGMTPSAWRDGGRGETIRWATAETDLGTMLVAATDKGICRLSFDEDEAALQAALSQGGDRAGRARTWPIWSGARWRR